MKILRNLIITNQRKSGKSKYDLKLAKLDVLNMRIRYHVNGSKRVLRTHIRDLDLLSLLNPINKPRIIFLTESVNKIQRLLINNVILLINN